MAKLDHTAPSLNIPPVSAISSRSAVSSVSCGLQSFRLSDFSQALEGSPDARIEPIAQGDGLGSAVKEAVSFRLTRSCNEQKFVGVCYVRLALRGPPAAELCMQPDRCHPRESVRLESARTCEAPAC